MSEETGFKTTQIGIFNPGRLSDREIERAFITRIKLFEYLLQGIVSETPGTIPQHYLIIGQRGMGKSTLLHRIAVELRKEPHRKSFLPLTFPEEQYNVDRLSKFWLNCLDALADALDREGSTDQLDQLDLDISRWASTARDSSATQLYEYFAQWVHRTARRPVLLVDNLGLIFDRLAREEQHQLRAILMDKDAPILVGASANTLTDTVEYGAPFYDAFQTQYLKKLTFEETMEVLENLAQMTGNSEFAITLRGNRARLRTLYQLTGGTPRTIVMLYPLIRGGFSLEVQTDLEGLMDVMTPCTRPVLKNFPSKCRSFSTQWRYIGTPSLWMTCARLPNSKTPNFLLNLNASTR
ncbi:ATP-binding protein [Salmonirosea aquatica]|uniref:AAA family ATPase n=1 Tax=Salmonirosea aquatica TaxID=2654236 RepID=A0A7C9FA66_9BACT|nr:AAA family ATPase [Cytophagaceae bacterium SJW1-29]